MRRQSPPIRPGPSPILRQSYGIIRRIAPRGFILSDTLPVGEFIAHDAKPPVLGSLNHGPMASLKSLLSGQSGSGPGVNPADSIENDPKRT